MLVAKSISNGFEGMLQTLYGQNEKLKNKLKAPHSNLNKRFERFDIWTLFLALNLSLISIVPDKIVFKHIQNSYLANFWQLQNELKLNNCVEYKYEFYTIL